MLFRKILILGVILFLIFSTAGAGITKEVSQYRARTVAQNWLHHLTESHGFGNSRFIPPETKIISEEVMVYKNRVVGYNFILFPRGHIIVPFRDELPPVKLYSDTTTLRIADDSDVAEWIREELFKIYEALDSKRQELASIDFSATHNGILWSLFDVDSSSFPNEYISATTGMEFLSLGPLLSTTWNQGNPYNNYCPLWKTGERTLTGCVATAAAQIMKYWNYPASGQGSTSYTWNNGQTDQTLSRDFTQSTYQWSLMKNSHGVGDTPAEKDAVARLMSDIGIAFHMNYGISSQSGSGAVTLDGTTVFPTYFKYKSTISAVYRTSYASDSAWMKVFRDEVQNSRPSQLRIRDPNAGGHSVVVDGYRDSPSEQIHINLGWSGSYDGWFLPNNIAGGGYNFSDVNYQAAVIGIEPPSVPGPTGFYRMNSNATYSYIADADQLITSWVGTADDGYFDLSLAGFDFQFYGTSVTSVRISTNGYITFGTTGATLSNASIPNVSQPNAIIAPFWDDLNATGLTSPPGVWWKFYGTAPNRYLVIEWYQVPRYGYPSSTYSFEIILYESTDRIKLQYLDVDSGTPYDFGAGATVGIENFDGTAGSQFSYNTASLSNGKAIEFIPRQPGIVDFDGDGSTDVAAFHLPTDQFFTDYAGNLGQYGWGGADCYPLVWDYDGNGTTEISVYHIPTNQWFVKGVPGGNLGQFGWGGNQSIPVPGDYNGDGVIERAFYHWPTNRWFVEGAGGSFTAYDFGWGGADCIPIAADYDGDGTTDMMLYHIPSNQWFVYGIGSFGQFGWGGANSIPVPGDYDGDGATDIAIYHVPSNQWFWRDKSGTPHFLGQYGWGGMASFPIPGDYDGDGVIERAFYRPSENRWFIEGEPAFVWGWGGSNFMPITSQIAIYNWFRFVLGKFQ